MKGVVTGALAWSGAGAIGFALVQLVVVALLARALSPVDFGEVAGVLVVLRVVQAVVELGVGPALVQRERLLPGEAVSALLLLVALGAVAAAVVTPLALPVASIAGTESAARLVPWLAVWLPLTAAAVVPRALLERELRFDVVAPVQLVSYVLGFAPVALVLALRGHGPFALVAGHVAEAALKATLLLLVRPPALRERPSLRGSRGLFGEGLRLMVARVLTTLAAELDAVVVGRALGGAALGMYQRAARLVDAPHSLLQRAASAPLRAFLSARRREGGSLAGATAGSVALVSIVTLPLAVFGGLHASDIVVVTLGEPWRAVSPALALMCAWLVLRGEHAVSSALLKVQGRALGIAWRTAVFALVLVVAISAGARQAGLEGAAAGALVAHAVRALLVVPAALSSAGLTLAGWLRAHAAGGIAAAAAGAASWGASAAVADGGPWLRMFVAAVVAAIACALALWPFRRELRDALDDDAGASGDGARSAP